MLYKRFVPNCKVIWIYSHIKLLANHIVKFSDAAIFLLYLLYLLYNTIHQALFFNRLLFGSLLLKSTIVYETECILFAQYKFFIAFTITHVHSLGRYIFWFLFITEALLFSDFNDLCFLLIVIQTNWAIISSLTIIKNYNHIFVGCLFYLASTCASWSTIMLAWMTWQFERIVLDANDASARPWCRCFIYSRRASINVYWVFWTSNESDVCVLISLVWVKITYSCDLCFESWTCLLRCLTTWWLLCALLIELLACIILLRLLRRSLCNNLVLTSKVVKLINFLAVLSMELFVLWAFFCYIILLRYVCWITFDKFTLSLDVSAVTLSLWSEAPFVKLVIVSKDKFVGFNFFLFCIFVLVLVLMMIRGAIFLALDLQFLGYRVAKQTPLWVLSGYFKSSMWRRLIAYNEAAILGR